MVNKKPLKGMQDVLPQTAILRRNVQDIIVKTFIENGFLEIATPSLDSIELFTSKQGGDNEKIMFKVLKRGDKLNINNISEVNDLVDMGLRFDLTLPLSRFYANNVNELPSPFKCFQIGNVWRGERPQKGRYRQFTQCDVDIFGDATINTEISLIKTVADALRKLGFTNEIKINNRILINELLEKHGLIESSEEVMIILDKLDKYTLEDAIKEVEQKNIDSIKFNSLYEEIIKLQNCSLEDLKTMFNSEVVSDFITIVETFKNSNNYNIKYDPTLIRGMGYYTGTIFEITDTRLNLSVAGGGRYDKLVEKLTGLSTPACGFSIGFERIIQILEETEQSFELTNEMIAILIDKNDQLNYPKLLEFTNKLQSENKIVNLVAKKKNTKKQIDDLTKLGYSKFINSSEFV